MPKTIQLYEEFHERERRLKAVQESKKHQQKQEAAKSKVNLRSHQLAYKKLERDLEAAIRYIDYD